MSPYLEEVRFHFPTRIHAGPGVRCLLPELLVEAGVTRPLVVTDAGVAALPIFDDVLGVLRAADLSFSTFAGVVGNPVKSQVEAGVQAYRDGACDAMVVMGGGAALDVGKAIALMVHHPGDLFDYEDGLPDAPPTDQHFPFLVAMPTTAGTGSEVGRSSVVSDDTTHVKKIIFSPRMLPPVVLLDAELTVGLPAGVTATTGLDALTHLLEAYLAKGFHPMCDGIALEGMRLVSAALPKVVAFARGDAQGDAQAHLEARAMMLHAAMMGAVAFQKGLGVTHSCAHALSTVCDMHHGLANGILLPYAMAFNGVAEPARMASIGWALGLGDNASTEAVVDWLHDLKARVGVPRHLAEVGVEAAHLDALVDAAWADPCHQNNPRPVQREDIRALIQEAWGP